MVYHGIGMTVYGERDYLPGGSFVTTQFFVVGYFPLFPIISKRISYERLSEQATWDINGYFVYETLPLDRRQVLSVYAWFIALVAPLLLWGKYEDALTELVGDAEWAAGLCLLTFGIVLLSPLILRRLAKRRKMVEWQRQSMGMCGRPLR